MEEGTPLRVENVTSPSPRGDNTSLITVSHHFRINRAIPLSEKELDVIRKYILIRKPWKIYINGMYIEIDPTTERDRSHGVKIKTRGATFHVTYSYKKGIAKVMIYPKSREGWVYYAQQIFGDEFVRRAIRIGISAHLGFNKDEITKVLWEGEEIKVTINWSDFGSSGDVEFEGVSEDGAKLARKILESKLKAVGEVVDAFESVKKMIAEIEVGLYKRERRDNIEDLNKRITKLEKVIEEIKDHVVLHTRYINLVMRDFENQHSGEQFHKQNDSSEVEGYA